VPLYRRAVDNLRTCEELRRDGAFDETIKAQLRRPGKDFSLVRDASGAWRFCPRVCDSHVASGAEPWSLSWVVENPFGQQPVRFRLEALMSAGSYDVPCIVVVAVFLPQASCLDRAHAGRRDASLKETPDGADRRGSSPRPIPARFPGTRRGSAGRKLEPCLNLMGHEATDSGSRGTARAVHRTYGGNPTPHSYGAWRTASSASISRPAAVHTRETESARWFDYVWNDGKGGYNVYRETIDFGRSIGVLWF
jgi:hypothetical protein